jgi:hypothetical protein
MRFVPHRILRGLLGLQLFCGHDNPSSKLKFVHYGRRDSVVIFQVLPLRSAIPETEKFAADHEGPASGGCKLGIYHGAAHGKHIVQLGIAKRFTPIRKVIDEECSTPLCNQNGCIDTSASLKSLFA